MHGTAPRVRRILSICPLLYRKQVPALHQIPGAYPDHPGGKGCACHLLSLLFRRYILGGKQVPPAGGLSSGAGAPGAAAAQAVAAAGAAAGSVDHPLPSPSPARDKMHQSRRHHVRKLPRSNGGIFLLLPPADCGFPARSLSDIHESSMGRDRDHLRESAQIPSLPVPPPISLQQPCEPFHNRQP